MQENCRKNGQWISPQRILYPKITQTNHESGSNSKLQNFCRHSQPLQENVILCVAFFVARAAFSKIYPIGGIPGGIPPPEPPEIAITSSILRIIDAASVADLIISVSYTHLTLPTKA